MKHQPDCNWEKSYCEYKETHHYCPHPEHACTCNPVEKKDTYEMKVLKALIFEYNPFYTEKELEGLSVEDLQQIVREAITLWRD